MNARSIHDRLVARYVGCVKGADLEALDPWIEVAPELLLDVCRFLRDERELWFDMLNCITAVDYLQTDAKKATQTDWQPHIELIYHLSSTMHRHRLALKLRLPRWLDDRPGKLPEVQSVCGLWRTAEWHEREVFDLCGVHFLDHPDLRRILCPNDWSGHPLRKDYEMPDEYQGIPTR